MTRFKTLLVAFLSVFFVGYPSLAQDDTKPPQETKKYKVSAEAMEIHQSGMLFDGHNDLPWMMRVKGGSSFDNVDIAKPTEFHTDIPRLKKGGVKAQFWSVYVPADRDMTGKALIETLEQIELVHEMCRRYPDVFEMADTAADIERISASGKIASMCGVEGGHSIQNSLQVLRELYKRGARYMTLTHSKTLGWADSATDEAKNNGLSPFGKEVVREMNRLGMLVDLSHVSSKCMKDTLEVSKAPVIFSHSSARALSDVPRNVPDDVLKLTAKNGGVVMVVFYSGYIVSADKLPKTQKDPKPYCDVKMVCDHIDHIVKVAGIDHVGIGSDFDGVSFLPEGLKDVSGYPNITQELLNRGYDKEKIHKILGGNVLRALKDAETVAAQMKKSGPGAVAENAKELFKVKVSSGDRERFQSLVTVPIKVEGYEKNFVTLNDPKTKTKIIGQIGWRSYNEVNDAVAKEDLQTQQELSFIVPSMEAGETLELVATDIGLTPNRNFEWHDDAVTAAELQYGNSSVVKYMYEPLDDASKERRGETYKVYHHVFSNDGSRLLTKGPGGLFPHHRGIYLGFNRISYQDSNGKKQQADVWHCNKGESQTHEYAFPKTGGPVYGRDLNRIDWNGRDGKPFISEMRETSTYRIQGATVIDFRTELMALQGDVRLDGDPQHAGVQFRAHMDVPDKSDKETYYIRPDGIAKPGEFRNWSNKKDETEINLKHINLPWHAMCISLPVKNSPWVIRDTGEEFSNKKFTVCYLVDPSNPKPSRFSERNYGRFGSYFEADIPSRKTLELRYRYWIHEGEMTVAEIQDLYEDMIKPIIAEQVE